MRRYHPQREVHPHGRPLRLSRPKRSQRHLVHHTV
ncbi:unnamed protein product [Phyllotreta striolata]|uniref:Uncharacterized protein n=1 Tax=Phyllotreta striolata TaxID=444603 RepID=A0A9N9TJS2_PHYSR|nr:unnamed protein product [Phyllotreta striolata]